MHSQLMFILILGALLGFLASTTAQSSSNAALTLAPTDCVAEPVTMSYCTSFMDKLDDCFYTSEAAAIASCFCPQSVLNYLAGCHQEWLDCVRSTIVNALFTGTTGLYYTWSTMCTELHALTYSPTTMIVTTPTLFDQQSCNDVILDCDTLTSSMTACNSAYSNDQSALTSCLCNTDMLYYGSRCDVDANESCLMTTRPASLMYSVEYCGKAVVSDTKSSTSHAYTSSTSVASPTSTYVPPMPTSTPSAGAATTSAVGINGVFWSMKDGYSVRLVVAIFVVVAFA